MMKTVKQTIDCPVRQRQVEVTFAKLRGWLRGRYEVISCPAMNDAGPHCNRDCRSLPERRSFIDFTAFKPE